MTKGPLWERGESTRSLLSPESSISMSWLTPTGCMRFPRASFVVIALAMTMATALAPGRVDAKVIERSDSPVVATEPAAILIDDARVLEGDDGLRKLVFRLRLSSPASEQVTVDFRTLDTTATLANLDYAAARSQIVFAPGTTLQWLTIPVMGDTSIEPDEAMLVRLSNAQNAAIADSQAVGMIVNDDFVKRLVVDDAETVEGNAGTKILSFTLRLTPPAVDPVTVTATTFDSTATALDLDYVPASATVTFAPGDSLAMFGVQVLGDTRIEPTELFSVRLSSLVGGEFADSVAVGTIRHDDLPSLAITDTSLAEGNGGSDSLRFALRLSAASPDTVMFAATTLDGTALANEPDYNATSRTITILPGGMLATFEVAVLGDKKVELDETMRVLLSALSGATFADSEAVGTILNDDVPALAIRDAAIAEGNTGSRTLIFELRLSAPPNAPVTLHYESLDGTALAAGGDYLPITGDTTFAIGQDLITLAVPVFGDTLLETNERFTLRVSAVQNATPATSDAAGTIANDERVQFTRIAHSVPMFVYGTLPPAFGDFNGDGRPDLPMYANTGTTFVEMPGVRSALGNGNYHGASWCDFDRDGDMDLVQMPYGQTETEYNRVQLLVNTNGSLTNVAPSLGMNIMGYGETPNWGDFNADGWPDLFLPFYAHVAPGHSFLFLNQNGTSFLDVSDSSGVALRDLPAGRRPEGTSVVDLNGDGTLDLYCGNHLLLNDGNARFTDVRAQVGLPQIFDEGSQFVDYDDDGDFDLYLRVQAGPTLFRNDGGNFTDVTPVLGIGTLGWEWGDRWADLDGDGDMDLLYFMPSTEGRLQVNQGDGTFREDSTFRGVLFGSTLSSFADIDGDGDLDIAAGAYDRQFVRNRTEQLARERTNYLKVRVEDAAGRLVMHGATVRLRSLDDPRHPVQSRIVDGGSGYLGQDEYTITFSGLGSGAYDLEVIFPSKPDAVRGVGPAQNPLLGGIRPGLAGPLLIVVRPSGDVSLTDDGVFTASAGNGSRSPRFTLSGASPNPARSLTRIGFSAPSAGTTVLAIHDVHGRRVRSLTLGAPESGTADVTWDLRDDAGQRVPVGVYFARLSGDGAPSRTKRIVVLQ